MVRTHIWKRKEQQRPTTEGIDSPDSRPSKGEVNQRKSPGNKQSFGCASSCVFENGIAVESDDIDCWKMSKLLPCIFRALLLTSAHLLGNHNNSGCLRCSPDARNGKELPESSKKVVGLGQTGFFNQKLLKIQLSMNIVQIASRLKRNASQPK